MRKFSSVPILIRYVVLLHFLPKLKAKKDYILLQFLLKEEPFNANFVQSYVKKCHVKNFLDFYFRNGLFFFSFRLKTPKIQCLNRPFASSFFVPLSCLYGFGGRHVMDDGECETRGNFVLRGAFGCTTQLVKKYTLVASKQV